MTRAAALRLSRRLKNLTGRDAFPTAEQRPHDWGVMVNGKLVMVKSVALHMVRHEHASKERPQFVMRRGVQFKSLPPGDTKIVG